MDGIHTQSERERERESVREMKEEEEREREGALPLCIGMRSLVLLGDRKVSLNLRREKRSYPQRSYS